MPTILAIIGQARAFMAAQGIDQWQDGYPDAGIMLGDMRDGTGYVLERDGRVCGIATVVFAGEPTYDIIHDGAWTTPEPYACIHRIAVDAAMRGTGIASELMREAENVIRARGVCSVRIDTHHGNLVMQGMLKKNGYAPCGTIYLENGAPRLALEKQLTP